MIERFVIQSDIKNFPIVEEHLFHFCQEYHVGRYYSTLIVATFQAVENAIVHGNHFRSYKLVTLRLGTCRGGLFVEVQDEGDGFDYSQFGKIPNQRVGKGEGIFVMNKLADNVLYSEGGKRVRMQFMVDGIDPAEALERIAVLQMAMQVVDV